MNKKAVIIVLSSLSAMVVVTTIALIGYVIGVNNDSVSREKHILALDEQNRNNLSNFTLRVKEMAQVPDMQVDGLKQVVSAAMQGRYGQDGSKAVFQWIQEQNLQLDQSTYSKIMTTMETGRRDFEAEQKKKIDACREYNTLLDKFPRGPLTRMLGFPQIDVDPKSNAEDAPCRILVASEVQEKFKNGTDDVIKVK